VGAAVVVVVGAAVVVAVDSGAAVVVVDSGAAVVVVSETVVVVLELPHPANTGSMMRANTKTPSRMRCFLFKISSLLA